MCAVCAVCVVCAAGGSWQGGEGVGVGGCLFGPADGPGARGGRDEGGNVAF